MLAGAAAPRALGGGRAGRTKAAPAAGARDARRRARAAPMPAYRRSGGARRPVHDYGPPLTAQDQARMRHAPPLRVGKRCAFVGRLQPTTKLRATWCLRFGPGGRAYEVTCTASRKSRKREVFADGCLVHSGGLGLREHGGGAGGADAPLFAHAYGAPASPGVARHPPPTRTRAQVRARRPPLRRRGARLRARARRER